MPYIHLHNGCPHWAIQFRKGLLQCILIYLQPLRCSCRRFGITHGLPRIRNTPCLNQLDQCVPVLSLSIFDDLFTRQCARLWLPSTRGVAAERADFCFLCSRRLPHKPFSAHTLHIDCLSLTFQCFLRVLLPSTVAPCLMFATILAPACPTAVRHAITPVTPHQASTYAFTTHFRHWIRSILSPHGLTDFEIPGGPPSWYSHPTIHPFLRV